MSNFSIVARLGVDESDAAKGLNSFSSLIKGKMGSLKGAFKFDGLEGDKRVERQLSSLAGELTTAKTATDALAIAADRLENSFKGSLGLGIAVGAGLALKSTLEKTAKAAGDLFDQFSKLMTFSASGKTVEEIEAQKRSLEDFAKEAEKMHESGGIINMILYGPAQKRVALSARREIQSLQSAAEKAKEAVDRSEAEDLKKQQDIKTDQIAGDERPAKLKEIEYRFDKLIEKAQKEKKPILEAQLKIEKAREISLQKQAFLVEDLKKKQQDTKEAQEESASAAKAQAETADKMREIDQKLADYYASKKSDSEQLLELEKRRLALAEDILFLGGEQQIKAKEKLLEREKEIDEVKSRQAEKEKQINDLQKERTEAANSIENAKSDIKTASVDRANSTLSELSQQRRGRSGQQARQVERLEERARRQAQRGNTEGADATLSKADKIRGGIKGLKESEKDPLKTMKEALKTSEEKLTDINDRLKALQSAVK